jgi:cell division protein ZapE
MSTTVADWNGWATLANDEHRAAPNGAGAISMRDVRGWLRRRHEPKFMLPSRFRDASFESFQIDGAHSEQRCTRARFMEFARPPRQARALRRRPAPKAEQRGIFLVGPPGVGKTHLLAAAYRAADEPKLFASFDELAAAAGPLRMPGLVDLLRDRRLVCIDEIVLEDPANILILVTLLGNMLGGGTRVLATANMPPQAASGQSGWLRSFEHELGRIAAAFTVLRIDGPDRRIALRRPAIQAQSSGGRILRCSWTELAELLRDTHPMHDATWLQRIDVIKVSGRISPTADKDETLRFVRFIDRVYDQDVAFRIDRSLATPNELVAALDGDPRYVWHVARGRSRLRELLSGA